MTQPNPMPGEADLSIDELERRQRAWCRYRNRCLGLVGDAPSLDCRQCRVDEQTMMDREDFKAEIEALAAFGRVLHRLANAPQSELELVWQRRKRAA